MKRRVTTKLLVTALCGAVFMSQTACIGSFALTTGLYSWNTSLSNKFVNWIVFLAFNVIPVYGIAVFADAFIFNSLEFWTGSNPMANADVETERRVVLNDGYELHYKRVSAEEMTVTIFHGGEAKQTLSMNISEAGMVVRDIDGALIARIVEEAGEVRVYNALNEVIAVHSVEEATELTRIYNEEGSRSLATFAAQQMQNGGHGFGVAAR